MGKSIPTGCYLGLHCNPKKTQHIALKPRHLMVKEQDHPGFPAQPGGHLSGLAAHPWPSFGVEHSGTHCKAAAQAELGGGWRKNRCSQDSTNFSKTECNYLNCNKSNKQTAGAVGLQEEPVCLLGDGVYLQRLFPSLLQWPHLHPTRRSPHL